MNFFICIIELIHFRQPGLITRRQIFLLHRLWVWCIWAAPHWQLPKNNKCAALWPSLCGRWHHEGSSEQNNPPALLLWPSAPTAVSTCFSLPVLQLLVFLWNAGTLIETSPVIINQEHEKLSPYHYSICIQQPAAEYWHSSHFIYDPVILDGASICLLISLILNTNIFFQVKTNRVYECVQQI